MLLSVSSFSIIYHTNHGFSDGQLSAIKWKYLLFFRFEMLDAARNKMRVKVAYVMMAATIAACLVMVFLGKRVRMIVPKLQMSA